MDCVNCGAPLRPKSNICRYCGTLNDTDLRGVEKRRAGGGASERKCPHCREAMETVELRTDGRMTVERCGSCMGIFFDPGELEDLLDASVSDVQEVDRERLDTLLAEEVDTDRPVVYVPCPDCGALMNRRNYGAKAGVIVDICKEHGVWLDGGELGSLMKWLKAGGGKHHGAHSAEQERLEERSKRQKEYLARALQPSGPEGADRRGDRSSLEGALGALLRMMQ
jgi:Zn-finger nucleic acid-binding protein